MIQLKHWLMATGGLVILITAVTRLNALDADSSSPNGAVHARFQNHLETRKVSTPIPFVVTPRPDPVIPELQRPNLIRARTHARSEAPKIAADVLDTEAKR